MSKYQLRRQQDELNRQREAGFNACVNGVFNEKPKKNAPVPTQHRSASRKTVPRKPAPQQRRNTWDKIDFSTHVQQQQQSYNVRQTATHNVQHKSIFQPTQSSPLTHSVQQQQYNQLFALQSELNSHARGNSANTNGHKPRKKWIRQTSLPLFADANDIEYDDDFVDEQVLKPLSTNVSRVNTPLLSVTSTDVQIKHTGLDETVEVVEIEVEHSESEDELEMSMDV